MVFLGRNAVILKGATQIANCTNVSIDISADLIKEYFQGSADPAVLESGNKTYRISIEKAYADNTYANDLLQGAKVTIEVRPNGTGSGKPKITLSNVVFTSWSLSITQDGVEMESIEGEGTGIAWGTQ